MGQQLVATTQHATDVGAYLYMILARWGGAHQRVIRDHVAHIEFGNPDARGYFADHLVGKIANLILGIKQHGDQGRTPHRVDRHQTVEARGQGWTEDGVYLCAHSFRQTALRTTSWVILSRPFGVFVLREPDTNSAKAIVGLRPSFSSHVRFGEHGAPV